MVFPSSNQLEQALPRFGLTAFRPGQAEVISQIVAGHDCLCVMPTGGGKSLCFQLPTLVRPGLTIVVSPLIALMKDQVDALQRRGIAATLVNSSLTGAEQSQRLQQIAEGKYQLVYVAPERLRNPRFLEAIRATPIQLLAIDEAHCISEWGHDFRPDYARLGQFREWLGGVQTVALTATATPRVRQDILQILQLRSPKQFITGFARKNLHFSVIPCHGDRDKEEEIHRFLQTKPGFGIIYAATRKRCEELAASLSQSLKMSFGAYHAGLTIEQRKYIQEQFMRGDLQAIVATNAFGMGIDKSDLRYVIHYNMPGSLEAYYQEAGRAGRDGKPSQCVLLYSYQDRYIQEFFIDNSYPPATMVQDIYEYLLEMPQDPIEMTQQEIKENLDLSLSAEAVGTSLQLLSRAGVLERLEAGAGLAMVRISSDLPTLVDLLPKTSERRRKVLRVLERAVGDRRYEAVYVHPRWLMDQTQLERDTLNEALRELCKLEAVEYIPPFRGRAVHFRRRDRTFAELQIDFRALEERKKAEYEKLDEVMAFAESKKCRQLSVLQYFGDPSAAPCGLCDRCMNRIGWFSLSSEEASNVSTVSNVKVADTPGAISPQVVELCRRVLRAVGRTHGRLGKILISQFLAGSENAKLQRLRLQQMPDFAMLKQLRQAEVSAFLDRMLAGGLLQQQEVNRHRPTVLVSELGQGVIEGKNLPQGMHLPPPLLKKLAAIAGGAESHAENIRQAVPLTAPVASKGMDASAKTKEAASVARVTPKEQQQKQEELFRREDSAASENTTVSQDAERAVEDWQWTWKLLQWNLPLFECAAIRRKTMDAILRDLEEAAQAGKEVRLDSLFDASLRGPLKKALVQLAQDEKAKLPGELSIALSRFPALRGLLQVVAKNSRSLAPPPPSTVTANPLF